VQIFSSTSVVIIDVLVQEDGNAAGHVLMQIVELWQSRKNLLSNQKHVQPREFELNQRRNDVVIIMPHGEVERKRVQ